MTKPNKSKKSYNLRPDTIEALEAIRDYYGFSFDVTVLEFLLHRELRKIEEEKNQDDQ